MLDKLSCLIQADHIDAIELLYGECRNNVTDVMAQWLGRLPHNRKVDGSSSGRVIQKTFKMVLAAFSSGARKMRKEWGC